MAQPRKTTRSPSLRITGDVLSLGSDVYGVPFVLNLASGAVESVAPAEANGTALRAPLLSYGELTPARLVELLCGGGYRAWFDRDGDAIAWTPLGRVLLGIHHQQELLRFTCARTFRNEVTEAEQLEFVARLNGSGLIARYVANDGFLHAEYDIAIGCGITGPQVLLAVHSFERNVEATLRRHEAEELLA